MARISREERLSALKCELGGGKVVSLYDLRGFSRVVVAAGDAEYCVAAVAAAETVREPLVERGVLVVPVVLPGGDAARGGRPSPTKDDKRFRASPSPWISGRGGSKSRRRRPRWRRGRGCTSVCAWTAACDRAGRGSRPGIDSPSSFPRRIRGVASWTASTGASAWTRE